MHRPDPPAPDPDPDRADADRAHRGHDPGAAGDLEPAAAPSSTSTTASHRPARKDPAARGRIEPWLDRWSARRLPTDRDGIPCAAGTPSLAWIGWGWLVIVAVLGIALLVLRQPLSDRLWPETRIQQLRADAAQALAQGRLTSPDGRGARELYEAALALDPDRGDARTGLSRVGQAALVQARLALAQHRYPDAQRAVELARAVGVPRAQADAVASALHDRQAAQARIEPLLAQAAAARQDGHLDGGADAALPLYQRVLALQPNSTQALEGREDTLADLLQQARQALDRGELAVAATTIQHARDADPGHADLPAALAELAQRTEQRRHRADVDLRREQLPRALDGYRIVLAMAPDDAGAVRGVARVAEAYARRSERLAADFRFDQAQAAWRDAHAIAPEAPAVLEAQRHLARARLSRSRVEPALPTGERQRRLRLWLQQAADAEARGDLLTPPGDSAFDKLRAARAIAPQDPRVLKASARLLPAAKACFEKELRGNRLGRAHECLEARHVLEGESVAVGDARRRLAQRWIAVGNERLGAGEMQAALAALAKARALDATAPGLDEFAQRLHAAGAAAD